MRGGDFFELLPQLRRIEGRSMVDQLGRRRRINALQSVEKLSQLLGEFLVGLLRALGRVDVAAVSLLHQATQGAMRELDRLATDCLRVAALKKRRLIDRAVVSQILNLDAAQPAA